MSTRKYFHNRLNVHDQFRVYQQNIFMYGTIPAGIRHNTLKNYIVILDSWIKLHNNKCSHNKNSWFGSIYISLVISPATAYLNPQGYRLERFGKHPYLGSDQAVNLTTQFANHEDMGD